MTYTTKEILCPCDGHTVWGMAYIPETGEKKAPLVIYSHGLGSDHTTGIPYAERLAQAGYAAYVFDFYGGTVGDANRSGGRMTQMSVLTQKRDLEAVLHAAKNWDFIDPERIALMGASQGGAVSTLAACDHQDAIAGLVLLFPAYSAPDDAHAMCPTLESVPETYPIFGGEMTLGKKYAEDIWDLDFFSLIKGYKGKVHLQHGDMDPIVNVSYAIRAKETFPDCELHIYKGAGHGFRETEYFDGSVQDVLEYLSGVFAG